jgi:hypothetical protein
LRATPSAICTTKIQDSVVGSDGFDGMNDEGASVCLGY